MSNPTKTCHGCDGCGMIADTRGSNPHSYEEYVCHACNGTGEVPALDDEAEPAERERAVLLAARRDAGWLT